MARVLFIGNSHTYLHYMPEMLERLSAAGGTAEKILADQVTGEGADLAWHWNNFPTRARIRSADWDYVVLQDRSGGPLEGKERLFSHARKLHALIREQGARTVFYMTWALRDHPGTQAEIAVVYADIADELRALLAPVGLAWQRVLRQQPDFPLYHRDGRHASATGAYLTACVFYGLLQKKSPLGLSGTLMLHGKPKVNLPPEVAAMLQKAAWESLERSSGHRNLKGNHSPSTENRTPSTVNSLRTYHGRKQAHTDDAG